MGVAVVTGAATRVGRAVALELAAAGLDIVVHAHSSARAAQSLVTEIVRVGRKAWLVTADFSRATEQQKFIDHVLQASAALEVVVHNAALYRRTELRHMDRPQFHQLIEVNLTAPLFITQGLLPALQRGASPSVIHLSDSATPRPYPGYAAYFTSKAGIDLLTRALALELSPAIRVNAVAPGTVAFPDSMARRTRESIAEAIPLGHIGTVEDIAKAVRFLALDALFITGQTLGVDGGRSVTP